MARRRAPRPRSVFKKSSPTNLRCRARCVSGAGSILRLVADNSRYWGRDRPPGGPLGDRPLPSEIDREAEFEHAVVAERERVLEIAQHIAHRDILAFHDPIARVDCRLSQYRVTQAHHPLVAEGRFAAGKL